MLRHGLTFGGKRNTDESEIDLPVENTGSIHLACITTETPHTS